MISILELDKLENHDRIKFVGDNSKYKPFYDTSILKKDKVYTIIHTSLRTSSDDYDEARRLRERKTYVGANINFYKFGAVSTVDTTKIKARKSYWGGNRIDVEINKYYPEDWELVGRRNDVVRAHRSSKLGVAYARNTLKKFRRDLKNFMSSKKRDFDRGLDQAQIAHKMDFLGKLTDEEKAIAELLWNYKDFDEFIRSFSTSKKEDNG